MEALRLSDFGFAYANADPTFSSLNLSVEEGELVILVGATGIGKTTLLRNLKPEIAPVGTRNGHVEVFGEELAFEQGTEPNPQVGYVFQDPDNQIVCDTVWHELAFGLENMGLDSTTMHVRVAEVAHFFGIEPWMHRACAELSGGQKQMLNLAAVLAMKPRLLLLDEPTAQLDPVAEKNFLHALFRINRELGITVIVSTHTPEAIVDYATGCIRLDSDGLAFADASVYKQPDEPGKHVQLAGSATIESTGEVITLDEVFFAYSRDSRPVLRDADLQVKQGSIHAVLGGNGSGKSTMLQLIANVHRPQHGRLRNALLDSQALLPQNPKTLFVCDTVAEELAEWEQRCGYTPAETAEMLESCGLSAQAQQHPYDLSGGQQQKLAFAKLMLTKPKLLMLDEPTKGLDGATRLDIAHTLRRYCNDGGTVVLATHDLAFVQAVADTVSLVFDGEIACTVPCADFFGENLFYVPLYDEFSRLLQAEHAKTKVQS